MTQDTISSDISSPQSSPLGDMLSPALIGLANGVQPGIVQVRRGDRGVGTGIIWRASGYIITNYHVVAGNEATVQDGSNDDPYRFKLSSHSAGNRNRAR